MSHHWKRADTNIFSHLDRVACQESGNIRIMTLQNAKILYIMLTEYFINFHILFIFIIYCTKKNGIRDSPLYCCSGS